MNFSVGVYRIAEDIAEHPDRWDLDDETDCYRNADGAAVARSVIVEALRELSCDLERS